jgi:hypothetical protein
MRLTDEQLRAVLARAEEIQRASSAVEVWNAEIRTIVETAEEMGLSRQAIERALAERRDLFPEPPRIGQLTWARSSDGKYYVAEVIQVGAHGATVRFLRGGEATLGDDALRPCGFLPGERIVCEWPWWGPWTASVVGYDATTRTVRLSDGWGSTETFPISEVWIAPPAAEAGNRSRFVWKVLAIGGVLGAIVGGVVTVLALR